MPLFVPSTQRRGRLERKDAVAKGSELLVAGEAKTCIRNPAGRQSHEPFDKRGRRAWSRRLVENCRAWCDPANDVLPSGYRIGIASPAVKIPSISDHSVSGSLLLLCKPVGPLSARSTI